MIPFLDLHKVSTGFERDFRKLYQKCTDLGGDVLENEDLTISVLNSY